MKLGKKIASILLCGAMVATMLTGCGKGDGGSDSAAKDTFTYAVSDDPGNTLNFFTADDRTSLTLAKMTNEPLFTLKADGSYNYYVADSFEASADGLTYTCKLKDGLKWSDDQPLTADDVVYTFEEYMKQDPAGILKVGDQNIEVKKVDDTTIEFKLPSVAASMPENISNVYILPKHVFAEKGSFDIDLTQGEGAVVGCGPYIFEEYKSGEYIKCKKNPNYMNGEAKIENAILQIITNPETAKAALQNGEIDGWVMLPNELEGMDDFKVNAYSEGRVAFLKLNRVADSMQDANYRKGIFYALNREEILKSSYTSMEYAEASVSFLPKNNSFYSEDVEQYNQDLAKAKELVKNGPKSLKLCYRVDDAAQTTQAQVIQAELKEIGIDVELCGVDLAAYMKTAYDNADKAYDMYLGGYVMTLDPDGFSVAFASGQMVNYASEELDQLFVDGRAEADPAKRKEIYNKAQKVVADEALFYPFGTNLRLLVTNPALEGIEDAGLVPVFTFEDMSKLYFK